VASYGTTIYDRGEPLVLTLHDHGHARSNRVDNRGVICIFGIANRMRVPATTCFHAGSYFSHYHWVH